MSTLDETRAFAESVAAAVSRSFSEPAPWHPGEAGDDRCPDLTIALREAGWPAVGTDPELLPFAGPAAFELGRALAPVSEIDLLLGGSSLVGDLVRYHDDANPAVMTGPDGLTLVRVTLSERLPYGDAFGVHRVLQSVIERGLPRPESETRKAAWVAATVGYCAGVGDRALALTIDYARERRAFGATLTALAPVQQLLADAATTVRGLRLLAMDCPAADALAYAGPALCRVTSACQQVVGAIGFTLEFPLQRAYRRARSLSLWADAVLAASDAQSGLTGRPRASS